MKILFLCVANSARSILAEGIAKKNWGDQHEFFSAGSGPASPHPAALKTLAKLGMSTDGFTSKHFSEFNLEEMDYIITLCKEEYCPVVKGNTLHWPFPDPFADSPEKTEELFLQTADKIKQKLSELMEKSH